jgi:hypothetical protein
MRVLTVAALVVSLSTPGLTNTLGLDLSAQIKGPDGIPFVDDFSSGATTPGKCGQEGEKKCLTIAGAAAHALLLCNGPPYCPKESPDGDAKYHRTRIVDKIEADPKNVTLSPEDLKAIKDLVGIMYSPVVVRAVWDVVDPTKASQ